MTPGGTLGEVQKRIGYHFRRAELLVAALTHYSAIEASQPRPSERLEFLGDAVLGLAMTDLLLAHYPHEDEGRLSKFRAGLVSTASFAAKARELRLHEHLMLGKGEEKTGGRGKASILAALYESVIGAVFLDGGYAAAKRIVARHFAAAIAQVATVRGADPKTELQEISQQTHGVIPTYRVVRAEGPDHARWYVVDVAVGEEVLGRGEGSSKRTAEQAAARQALQRWLARGKSAETPTR